MTIEKKTRNRLVLAVATLLLIVIILFIFMKANDLSITGYASSENNGNQASVLIEDLLPDIQIIPELPPMPEVEEDEVIPPGNSSGSSGSGSSGRSGGGGSGNSPSVPPGQAKKDNSTNQTQNNNSNSGQGNSSQNNSSNNSNNNQSSNNSAKKLAKMPFGLDLKLNGLLQNEGKEFQGKFRFNLEKLNRKISAFDLNFTEDIDISDIIGDSDFTLGKAFMHHTSGYLENISLYVPIKPGDVAVVVCSNASSYDEIYYGCSELPHITNEELLYLDNPRIELSLDGLYFIVYGITGTGATGVDVDILGTDTANATDPGEDPNAIAGNITELIFPSGASGVTQSWQGYFGNITGTITLEDSSGNVLYNWSETSPEGVILASTNESINWDNVQCFNFTSTGDYTGESGTGGTTNLYGTNLTQLESFYNINPTDMDGVDETFTLEGGGTHNLFYINNNEFSEGECKNSRIFSNESIGEDDLFEEALLYEPTTHSVVFAGLLNQDAPGFDKDLHDFELLVLEDGHGTDTLTSTYYFYAQMY